MFLLKNDHVSRRSRIYYYYYIKKTYMCNTLYNIVTSNAIIQCFIYFLLVLFLHLISLNENYSDDMCISFKPISDEL